jgi:hypothetical protein
MFDWLVAAINSAIGEDKDCAASVGVLDIYGFESFEYNDLEQVCVGGAAWRWRWWLSTCSREGQQGWASLCLLLRVVLLACCACGTGLVTLPS